jgi:hypothetical protein
MMNDEELAVKLHALPCRMLPGIIMALNSGHAVEDVLQAAEFNLEHDLLQKWVKSGGKI